MSKVGQFKKQPSGFATKAIHVGQAPENWNDMAVSPPIVMSSTYKQDSPGNYRVSIEKLHRTKISKTTFLYTRCTSTVVREMLPDVHWKNA